MGLESTRRVIDAILEQRHPAGSIELAKKTAELIAEAYKDAKAEERDDLARRFRKAFGVNDADLERIFGAERPSKIEQSLRQVDEGDFMNLVTEGWFARYLEYTEESEAPAQYHFGSAVTAVAAAIGRRPLLGWEARDTYPNLYTMLIGPTGARKGSAVQMAIKVVNTAVRVPLLPSEGTHQGFAEALHRRFKQTKRWSDGLIVADEFGTLVSDDKNKKDLVKWLTEWYDSKDYWERGLRSEKKVYALYHIYVNVIGGSNMAWLRQMPGDAITGGFMPRFILFPATDKRHWKAFPKFDHNLKVELMTHLEETLVDIPDELPIDVSAEQYITRWYEKDVRAQYEDTTNEQFQAWLARKQAAALKLATIWQMVDGGPKDALTVEWLEKARAIVDYGDRAVLQVYSQLGVRREAEGVDMVYQFLRRHGGSAIQSKIIRGMRNQLRKNRILDALQTLRDSGQVRMSSHPVAGVSWHLIDGHGDD